MAKTRISPETGEKKKKQMERLELKKCNNLNSEFNK